MSQRPSRPLALFAALAFTAQATGAAGIPAALVRSPAAFPPPAARFAALPPGRAAAAPSRPAGPGAFARWLESARVVASALAEAALASAAPATETPAPRPADPLAEALAAAARSEVSRAPAVEAVPPPPLRDEPPPMDRMLLALDKGESVEAVLSGGEADFSTPNPAMLSAAFPTIPAFREAWIEQSGLRVRLSYLNAHGVVTGGEDGYLAVFADGATRFSREKDLAPAYRRSYPIYWHDEAVEMELVLENTTGETLRDLHVEAAQETFRPVGTAGTRLAPPAEKTVGELAPGARTTVRWTVALHATGHAAVNFEQTHVTVTSGKDASTAPLLDAPQAGVADPPGPALLP
jgi:hypothetical protein